MIFIKTKNVSKDEIISLIQEYHIEIPKNYKRWKKTELKNYIDNYVIIYVKRIQKFIHKHIYGFFFKRYKQRICGLVGSDSFPQQYVNDVDVITQEFLPDIHPLRICAIYEKKRTNSLGELIPQEKQEEYAYAFDIQSLYKLLPFSPYNMTANPKTTVVHDTGQRRSEMTTVVNPWSQRVLMPIQVMEIYRLFELIKLVCPTFFDEEMELNPTFFGNELYIKCPTKQQQEYIQKMKRIRQFSLKQRISNIFCEMNYLENYTDRKWLDEMTRNHLYDFLMNCHKEWNQLVSSEKRKIFVFKDPFRGIIQSITRQSSIDIIKEACVVFIENIVFSDVSRVNKQTGIFFIIQSFVNHSSTARLSYGDMFL